MKIKNIDLEEFDVWRSFKIKYEYLGVRTIPRLYDDLHNQMLNDFLMKYGGYIWK